MNGIFRSLHCLWNGRSIGKALLVVGLVLCVYQAWRKWSTRRLIRKLQGKVILITGASSGLGEALARVFYAVGAKVILASRNHQRLEQLKFELSNEPKKDFQVQLNRSPPKILVLDLSDSASIPQKCQEAVGLYGRIDILVNNAGVSSRGCVLDTDLSVDRRVMEVNFFGTVAVTKGILPSMMEQGHGQVVIISSLQGKMGLPSRSSYSASKHALQGYFDSLRCELSPCGIKVTVVSPGYIATQLSVNALSGDGTKHGVVDANTSRGMSPHHAAGTILEAVAKGRRDLVLAKPLHHLALYVQVFCPSLLDWVLQQRTNNPT